MIANIRALCSFLLSRPISNDSPPGFIMLEKFLLQGLLMWLLLLELWLLSKQAWVCNIHGIFVEGEKFTAFIRLILQCKTNSR